MCDRIETLQREALVQLSESDVGPNIGQVLPVCLSVSWSSCVQRRDAARRVAAQNKLLLAWPFHVLDRCELQVSVVERLTDADDNIHTCNELSRIYSV